MNKKHLTPVKAIRQYCKFECCVGDMKSWKFCTRKVCPLYCYRLGKRNSKQADSSQLSTKNTHSSSKEQLTL